MLTVLIATRDRSHTLWSVLEAFARLQSPDGGWKLVIVDNGSTDATGEVLAKVATRLPLTTLYEPRPGKNAALNRGLAKIEGDLVVFSDDDVFPSPDWLVRLRAAADANPAFAIFGGRINPRWESPPPPVLAALDPAPLFAVTPSTLVEGEIDPAHVFGPNMAIRSQAFAEGLRFNESIGPKGASYPMGSETELVMRLARQRCRAWHVEGASVEHFIRKEQLADQWIFQRAIRFGRGQLRLDPHEKRWLGVPRHLVRDLPLAYLRLAWAAASRRPADAMKARWRIGFLLGKAIEGRNLRRERTMITRPAD